MAVIRSREISLTLLYQAMSQCKALYKDHSETIMGNMDSIVFLGGREASMIHLKNAVTFNTKMELLPCDMYIYQQLGKFGRDFSDRKSTRLNSSHRL